MKHTGLFFIPSVLVLTLSGCNNATTNKDFYVISEASKTIFNVGESFTTEGLVLSDKSDLSITINDYMSSINSGYVFTMSDVGSHSVTISYPGYNSYSYTINVTNYPKLEVAQEPNKTEYVLNERLDLEGLVITADGVEITDYQTSIADSSCLRNVGELEIVVSKERCQSTSFTIDVYPLRQLFVSSYPTVTSYEEGDSFTSVGLVVIDERDNVVNDYSLSIAEGSILKGVATKTVTISKTDYISASFDIIVKEKEGGEVRNRNIKIYYLNDTHGSYARDDSESEGGMAYISKYIKDRKDDYTVVLSGGDMFQGGYESNETHGSIMIDAMNEIGFDAMTIGNHEFDWGEEYLPSYKAQLDCPMLAANIFYNEEGENRPTWCQPYTYFDKGDVRIGVIGAVQADIGTSIVGSVSENFKFPNPTSYVMKYSYELRMNHGCDLIISVFHDAGFEGYNGEPTKFKALTDIDEQTGFKYVDAMFFAHDHYRKNGTYNGVPYLEAGCNGKNLGIMTFALSSSDISYTVDSSNTQVIWCDSDCLYQDASFDQINEKYATVIAKGEEVIYNFKNSYTSDSFTTVACMAMLWYVNSHKSDFDNETVTMATHNSGGVRDNVDKGEMKLRKFIKVFPFDNLLSLQKCSSYNLSRYESYDYYIKYGTPVLEGDGYARVISINYITEKSNADRFQVSYKNYDITAKEVLYQYLINKINPNL